MEVWLLWLMFGGLSCLVAVRADDAVPWPEKKAQLVDVGAAEHHRVRRQGTARMPLRITPVYDDDSVNALPTANRTILQELVQEMVSYYSVRYSVDRLTAPIRISPSCAGGNYFPTKSDSTKIACRESCTVTTKCGLAVVKPVHLKACYSCQAGGLNCRYSGSNGTGGTNSDIVVYISAKHESLCATTGSSTLGFAQHCAQESVLNRPIFGNLNLCPNRLETSKSVRPHLRGLILHEMYHILAMTPSLFAFYRDENGAPRTSRGMDGFPNLSPQFLTTTMNGFDFPANSVYSWSDSVVDTTTIPWQSATGTTQLAYYIMKTPKVRSYVRQHFNCPSLAGAQLENQGGRGTALAHWDQRVFGNEVLTGVTTSEYIFSNLTMSLMEDSGWYDANTSLAEPLILGEGLGCDFVRTSCRAWMTSKESQNLDISPYCKETTNTGHSLRCEPERRAVALCSLRQYDQPLPAQYQYFGGALTIPGVVSGDLDKYGSQVALADYCPMLNRFNKNDMTNSICTIESNAPTASDVLDLQYYGSGSRCIQQGGQFSRVSGRVRVTPRLYGAGCYRVHCVAPSSLFVDVGTNRINCTKRSSAPVSVNVTINGDVFNGSIICPDYKTVCYGSLITSSLPAQVQCPNNFNCPVPSSSSRLLTWTVWKSVLILLVLLKVLL
ncbi:leishmanolysin-like peptidase [Sycon ciliatum]|uniref:leishmanolysin-like peptidase n=1 Tax=Sycon ciliatum TaxID=27933 RepID=UPI0031F71333